MNTYSISIQLNRNHPLIIQTILQLVFYKKAAPMRNGFFIDFTLANQESHYALLK